MSEELKEPKKLTDLEAVLAQYPNVSVEEQRTGDSFRIIESTDDFDTDTRKIYVSLRLNRETKLINPFLSHKIPSIDEYVYIEFPTEGAVCTGVEYEDIHGLLTLAKAGLEIMQTYKQLSDEERFRMPHSYSRRVYDRGHVWESFQLTYDCLERTLSAIKKELGEE